MGKVTLVALLYVGLCVVFLSNFVIATPITEIGTYTMLPGDSISLPGQFSLKYANFQQNTSWYRLQQLVIGNMASFELVSSSGERVYSFFTSNLETEEMKTFSTGFYLYVAPLSGNNPEVKIKIVAGDLTVCTDSDIAIMGIGAASGINYAVRGETRFIIENMTGRYESNERDSCVDQNTVKEYSCNSDASLRIETTYRCPAECSNGVCLQLSGPITEKVACVFKGLNPEGRPEKKCYSNDGKYSCSINTNTDDASSVQLATECSVKVEGEKGKKITWKSSCGDYATTLIDGDDETVTFDCSGNLTQPPVEGVAEKVKCVFTNSTTEQECYGRNDVTGKSFSCRGVETCVVDVFGEKLSDDSNKHQSLTWKSSCGGYAFTALDGDNEYAVFYCSKEVISESNSFSSAGWQCYDGDAQKEQAYDICKSSEEWQAIANDYCQGKCSKETGKCGVNSFSVGAQCGTNIIINPVLDSKVPIDIAEKRKEGTTITCNGCLVDDKCYPLGYRKDGNFCSDSNEFIVQLDADLKCDNSFECGSNVCVSGKCISPGLIENILNWFKKLFGG